jgi:hypothetical protein
MFVLSRASLDPSLLFLALLALNSAMLTARAVRAPHRIDRPASDEGLELAGALIGALVLPALLSPRLIDLAPVLLLVLGAATMLSFFMQRLSMPGILWLSSQAGALVVSSVWAALFIRETHLPVWAQACAWAGLGVGVCIASVNAAACFVREAVLTHEAWLLPTAAPHTPRLAPCPKVSLHLPCYAEPPEVVKATMDCLAALDYPDFEVLVCDNNTRDQRLWRPLEAHCLRLNQGLGREVFRFFHVAPLAGAKAGALNVCLQKMAPDAEIVGVVDADYLSRSDFLSRLVPFFAEPLLGYIQTPHDYRDYDQSDYLRACHWEYMPANKVDWPGVSEYGGAFTIGTMCLLRTAALRRAGGWAEWCLTEDSEISVRIRAAGYRGLYFGETFGRGLIPETFDDYRKQRFRWTAGPVQQLRRHWRLFLPAPFAPPLPGWTKLLEVTRCATPLANLSGIVIAALATLATGLAVASGQMAPLDIPNVTWLILALGLATWGVRTVHRYRLAGCNAPIDMIRGEIARASLDYVVLSAGIAGLSRRPLAWRRTPKFAVRSAGSAPFAVARGETMAGFGCMAFAVLGLLGNQMWGGELALLAGLGLTMMGLRFLCAPAMVAMGIGHAEHRARRLTPEPQTVTA